MMSVLLQWVNHFADSPENVYAVQSKMMPLLSYNLSSLLLLSLRDIRYEMVIHGLRCCLDDHWHDPGFVCMMVNMKNPFNLVSRQSLLDI